MQKGPPTPKGFRDIKPELAKKRRAAINKIVEVLEGFGFEPIETPTIEFASTLKGKYGEEERLIYEFKDRGGRELALRYDLTVPLARFIASNQNLIAKGPFRRYQIGQVFRGENPQHGRWREFTQLDFDTVGSSNLTEDAKIIAAVLKAAKSVGLETPVMAVNDRKNFEGVPIDIITAIDKIHKIGRPGVEEELRAKGFSETEIGRYIEKILNCQKTPDLKEIFLSLNEFGLTESHEFFFDASLARGLNYYTGSIFELRPSADPKSLSIGAGGRYNNLIGMFAKKPTPAVGFSFGLDRLIEAISG